MRSARSRRLYADARDHLRERLGAYSGELFANRRWARNAIVGLLLASSGIIGLWAIGFFTIDFVREIIRPRLLTDGIAALSPADQQNVIAVMRTGKLDEPKSVTSCLIRSGCTSRRWTGSIWRSRSRAFGSSARLQIA